MEGEQQLQHAIADLCQDWSLSASLRFLAPLEEMTD